MKHESYENSKVEINDGLLFSEIYEKPYIPMELLSQIKEADILLLPYEGFRDRADYLFPEETSKVYQYFLNHIKDTEFKFEICSSDEDYKELELHADLINIVNIIVNSAAYSIVIGLITNYLYDKLKDYNKKDTDVNANVNITIESKGKSKVISYEGSIENFERTMKSLDEHIFK